MEPLEEPQEPLEEPRELLEEPQEAPKEEVNLDQMVGNNLVKRMACWVGVEKGKEGMQTLLIP